MRMLLLAGPNVGYPAETIAEFKKKLNNCLNLNTENSEQILLQISAHGTYNNELAMLGEDGKTVVIPLPQIIKQLIEGFTKEQQERIVIDVFACAVGKNVRTTQKDQTQDLTNQPLQKTTQAQAEAETKYERRLRRVLKSTKMLILNGGKYISGDSENDEAMSNSKGKTSIEEILMERILLSQTLKLRVKEDNKEGKFFKSGTVKLKDFTKTPNISDEENKEKIRNFIKEKLSQRINEARELLSLQALDKTNIDQLLTKDAIDKYINKALFVEIRKLSKKDGKEKIEKTIQNIKTLLLAGADVNTLNYNGFTPLYIVAQEGHIEVAKALIEAGADVNKPNKNGDMPLDIAIYDGNIALVEALIKGGANVNKANKNGDIPLYIEAKSEHTEMVKVLMAADVNTANKVWFAQLTAQKVNIKVVKTLINAGADLDKENEDGFTPLHIAACQKNKELVEALIKAGADVNKIDEKNRVTPLYFAIELGYEEVAKALIEAGADVNIENKRGFMPLYFAAQNGHKEVVKALIEAGAKTNIDLNNIDLTGIKLSAEQVRQAVLINSNNLRGANLEGIDLCGINFNGADLTGVRVNQNQLVDYFKEIPAKKHYGVTNHPLMQLMFTPKLWKEQEPSRSPKPSTGSSVIPENQAPPKVVLVREIKNGQKLYSLKTVSELNDLKASQKGSSQEKNQIKIYGYKDKGNSR